MTRYVAEGAAAPRRSCWSSRSAARPARSSASGSATQLVDGRARARPTRPRVTRPERRWWRCCSPRTDDERRGAHGSGCATRWSASTPPPSPPPTSSASWCSTASASPATPTPAPGSSRTSTTSSPRSSTTSTCARSAPSTGDPAVQPRRRAAASPAAAVGDPQARLEPEPTSDRPPPPAARVAFARAVRDGDRPAQAPARRPHLRRPAQPARRRARRRRRAGRASRMRQRWQVVLVDEFQDTDPVQWQVLDRAFTGHAHDGADRRPEAGDLRVPRRRRRHLPRAPPAPPTTAHDARHQLAQRRGRCSTRSRCCSAARRSATPRSWCATSRPHHAGSRLVGAPPARRCGCGSSGAQTSRRRPGARRRRRDVVREHVARDLAADIARLLGSGATFDGRAAAAGDVAVHRCRTHDAGEPVQRGARRRLGVPAVRRRRRQRLRHAGGDGLAAAAGGAGAAAPLGPGPRPPR